MSFSPYSYTSICTIFFENETNETSQHISSQEQSNSGLIQNCIQRNDAVLSRFIISSVIGKNSLQSLIIFFSKGFFHSHPMWDIWCFTRYLIFMVYFWNDYTQKYKFQPNLRYASSMSSAQNKTSHWN